MSPLARLAAVAALVACTACVTTNPALHPAPQGRPLRVEVDADVVAAAEKARPPDDQGFSIGGDLGRETQKRTYLLLHGDKEIDEQDFYEVAGDVDAARQVKEYRDVMVLLQYIGFYGAQIPAGMSCFVTGFGCVWSTIALLVFPPFVLVGIPFIAVAGGMGILWELVGVSIGNVAAGNVKRRSYVLPLERAQKAAAAYNDKHGYPNVMPVRVPADAGFKASALAPATAADVDDATGCVDETAVARDLESLGGDRVRARLRVEKAPGNSRRIALTLFSGKDFASTVTRDIVITEAECRDVPRMVSRMARARLDEAQAH